MISPNPPTATPMRKPILVKIDPLPSSAMGAFILAVASNHMVGRGEMVGAKDIVGEADGSCETVGAKLIVGDTEGVDEGAEDGRFVGTALGTWEGAAVVGL